MSQEIQINGMNSEQIINILNQFDWNWYIAADYLDCDPHELKSLFEKMQPNTDLPQIQPGTFDGAQISPENLSKLQAFVRGTLKDTLPLLFDEEITKERKSEIASEILLDMGLAYRLTHMKEYVETYEILENEALSLAQWREQMKYLSLVEEALFKISARLAQQEKQKKEEAKAASEQEEDDIEEEGQS